MKIIITEKQYGILLKESISDDLDFIEYIKDVEGKVIDKSTGLHKAYKDSVGVVTIGYGHSENRDPNVKMGMKIPETKAISYLKNDLKTDELKVKNYVAEKFPSYTLNDEQIQILVDYNYNVGLSKFPKFVKAVVTKDWETAKKEYKRYAGGKELTDRNTKFFNKFLANKGKKTTTTKPKSSSIVGIKIYPKKTSDSDYTNVRSSPEVNTGFINNLITVVYYPNLIGTIQKSQKDDTGKTWYYVKLADGTSWFYDYGWVRSDVVTK
jgi:lysozyme